MNIFLWIVQIVVAVKLLSMSVSHGLLHNKMEMKQGIQKMGKKSKPLLIGSALLMLIGAIGIILPGVIPFIPMAVPISASVIGIIMIAGMLFHVNCRETPKIFAGVILFILCAVILLGRLFIVKL